ncbi:hypothetical protein HHK36_017989 [Tetracentron sinense]|uniref:U-box domain-containing protein n=1 Tax=Tetracentron sinense TaxID=13715 RepID=A0A834YY32_TETSI|nr:hypothetical protein HHK36_017989 [Tetracentron sinense]
MDEIDVPRYFLCPISLQIMRDPVTVSTGITYDRKCIERWIFSSKKNTCPITKQVLSNTDLTPNHTVRRLIQAWCTLNASHGVERILTPKPPIDKTQIVKLLNDSRVPQLQMKSLQKLRLVASESESNQRCMEAAGAIEFLSSIIKNDSFMAIEGSSDDGFELTRASDEALSILSYLQISVAGLKNLLGKHGEFIESLMQVLQRGSYQSQALRLLIELGPLGRNRVKLVEADAVFVLVQLLLDTIEKRACEMILVVLDQLCGCAEGRAELLKHDAGLVVVSKKILRVSQLASESGVRILSSISKFSATSNVLQEMLQAGVVSKLCLVLQMDCSIKVKEKAQDILRSHSRDWKNSSCIPVHLLSSYPY